MFVKSTISKRYYNSVKVKECDSNEKYENVTLQLIELISTSFIRAIEDKHLKGI